MQTKDIKTKAKSFLMVNSYQPIVVFTMLISVFLAFFMFTVFLSMVNRWLIIIGILLLLCLYFSSAPLKYSLTDYYMRSYNQNTPERLVIFEGYKREYVFKAIILRLINTGIMLGLSLLFIFPGMIYFARSSYSYYLIKVNPELTAWQAIKQSNRLMKNKTMQYLKFSFSFFAWFLAVIGTFGIFSFYVSPYFQTAKSIFFRNVLLGKEDDDPNYLDEVNTQISKILNSEIENIEKELMMLQKKTAQQQAQAKPLQAVQPPAAPTPPAPQKKAPATDSGERLYMDDVGDIRGIVSGIDDIEEIVLPELKNANVGFSVSDFNTRDIEIMENETFDEFKTRLAQLRKERSEAKNPQKILTDEPHKLRTITPSAPKAEPEPASTVKPEPISTPKPEPISTPKAEPVSTVKAEPVSTVKPAPNVGQSITAQTTGTGYTNTASGATKMTRAEILEKLKQDRERRLQNVHSQEKDKQ